MPYRLLIARMGCVLLMFSHSVWAADNWPEFRGPSGDGIAAESVLPVSIDPQSMRWETEIHGRGWSSPVVWNDQIWLTTATVDGTKLSVLCVNRSDGKIVRDIVLLEQSDPQFCHPTNSYASPTPAIESGRVYVHFGSAMTACLDTATGMVIWQRTDLQCDHFRGPASSPILHDDKLLVAYDGVDHQYVVAFDKETGETIWRTDRDVDYGTDNVDWMKAYATGQIIDVGGQTQWVAPTASATIAYDPQNGSELWRVYHGGMNASSRPIMRDEVLFITNGMGQMVAVNPIATTPSDSAAGISPVDISETGIVWGDKKNVAKKASPIIVGDLLYMNSDDGIISARNVGDGRTVWRQRVGTEYAASPVSANDLIYFFSTRGDVVTVRPPMVEGDEPKIVAQTTIGDGFMASPAVVENEMILRSRSKLYLFSQPPH